MAVKTKDDRDLTWMLECEYTLVTNKEQWLSWKVDLPELIAIDLETTGLNKYSDSIVGLSLAKEEKKAIYIPIEHHYDPLTQTNPNFEDLDYIFKELDEMFRERKALAYNAKFDVGFLRRYGVNIKSNFEDSMVSVYMYDANTKKIGLKPSTLKFLGIEMLEITDLFVTYNEKGVPKKPKKNEIDFKSLPITDDVVNYACSDVDMTLRLYNKLEYVRKESPAVYRIERDLQPVVMRMEDNGVWLDTDYLSRLPREVERRLAPIKRAIMEYFGDDELDIQSNEMLAAALLKKGASLEYNETEKTKKRNYIVDKNALARLEKDGFKIAPLIIEFRQFEKALSTYLINLFEAAQKGVRARFKLNPLATASGRFSAGQGKSLEGPSSTKEKPDDGYARINVQQITSNKAPIWFPATLIKQRRLKETGQVVYTHEFTEWDTSEFYALRAAKKQQKAKKATKAKEKEVVKVKRKILEDLTAQKKGDNLGM